MRVKATARGRALARACVCATGGGEHECLASSRCGCPANSGDEETEKGGNKEIEGEAHIAL